MQALSASSSSRAIHSSTRLSFVRAAAPRPQGARSPAAVKCQAHRSASPSPAPIQKSSLASGVACNAVLTAASPMIVAAKTSTVAPSAADPLVELQRLVLQAQEEKELWASQLALHEQQEQQVRARLDATALRQAHSHAALSSLRHLLDAARHVAREQHLAVFAESVYMCGRQRSTDQEEERQVLASASRDAAEQLQHYEQTLTRLVGTVVASLAASEDTLPSLPSSSLGGTGLAAAPVEQLPLAAAVAAVPRNNIVPRLKGKGKVTLLQPRKPRAALPAV